MTPTRVTVNKRALSLGVGETETLIASVTSNDVIGKTVKFSTSDPAIATVTPVQGKVTGIAAGTATISATAANGKTATCVVTVVETEGG
nr:MAG TPA: tail tube protein [Caudoviricetes sp.]